MNELVDQYQYTFAWGVYLFSGLVFCLFWWWATSRLTRNVLRELLRGLALVMIFTPWRVGETWDHLAPASMILAMDLLLGSAEKGLAAFLMLMVVFALMLVAMIIRRLTSGQEATRRRMRMRRRNEKWNF